MDTTEFAEKPVQAPRSLMQRELKQFTHHIALERGLAENTVSSYTIDLTRFIEFLEQKSISSFANVQTAHILEFLTMLADMGLGTSSRTRYLYSIRSLYKFLSSVQLSPTNPSELVDLPKPQRLLPEVLSYPQIAKILDQPDTNPPSGCMPLFGGVRGFTRFGDLGFRTLFGSKWYVADYYLGLTLLALGLSALGCTHQPDSPSSDDAGVTLTAV